MSQSQDQPQINVIPSNSSSYITLEELLNAPSMPENLPRFEIIKECEVARDLGSDDGSINSEDESDYEDIEEVFPCECRYDENFSGNSESQACGTSANCINRELFIECDSEECPCRDRCQNQRFQRRQYAKVKVVETKGKGFGLFTCEDLKPGSLVMEYVGEIVTPDQMGRRAELYASQGQSHFYFMTLRPNQIIDATRRGNLSRFLNHSCSPNCLTQKWIVGGRIKIGLFTLKGIKAGTELTFDYKFVRFGTEPQKCLCGEANCTGFIGTTSKDSPDKKRKRKKKLLSKYSEESSGEELTADDEEEQEQEANQAKLFLETKPLKIENVKEMALVVKRLLQTEDCEEIKCLLKIILQTTSALCLRKFLSLHGLKLLKSLFMEHFKEQDREIIKFVLDILLMLPIGTKNTIEDSGWLEKLEQCKGKEALAEGEKEKEEDLEIILKKVNEILTKWNSLERIFTIPKKTSEPSNDYLSSLSASLKPTQRQSTTTTTTASKNEYENELMRAPQEFSSALQRKRNWRQNDEEHTEEKGKGKEETIGRNGTGVEAEAEDENVNNSRTSSPTKRKVSLTSSPSKSRPSNPPSMIPDPMWLSTQTPEGRTYYYHSVTRETSWDLPLIAKREEGELFEERDREREQVREREQRDHHNYERDRTFYNPTNQSRDQRYTRNENRDRYVDRNRDLEGQRYNRRDERSYPDSRDRDYDYNGGRKKDNFNFEHKHSNVNNTNTSNTITSTTRTHTGIVTSSLLEGVEDSSQLAAVIERAKARRNNNSDNQNSFTDGGTDEVKKKTVATAASTESLSLSSLGFEKVHLSDSKANSKIREEISGVVIRFLSHYKEELGDDFKELARKNTHKILEKESSDFDMKAGGSFELTAKKKIKIKSYLAEVLKNRNIKLKSEHESFLN